MARIKAEERERRKRTYDALILDIFLTEGWLAISYDRLARELSLSKSTLQRYYPSRSCFASALQGKIMPVMVQLLDFDSHEAFIESWQQAMASNPLFRNVVRMFIDNLLSTAPHFSSRESIKSLVGLLGSKMTEQEAYAVIHQVLGSSVLFFARE